MTNQDMFEQQAELLLKTQDQLLEQMNICDKLRWKLATAIGQLAQLRAEKWALLEENERLERLIDNHWLAVKSELPNGI